MLNVESSGLAVADVSQLDAKLLVFLSDVKQKYVQNRKYVCVVGADVEGGAVPLVVFCLRGTEKVNSKTVQKN